MIRSKGRKTDPTRLDDHAPEIVTITPVMGEELVFMNSTILDIDARRDTDAVLRGEVPSTLTQTIPVLDKSSPKHTKPVLFVADADPALRRRLTAALKHRFGADYHVHSAATPEA